MESSIPAAEPPCDNALNRLHIIVLSKRAVSGDRYGLLLRTSALYFVSGYQDSLETEALFSLCTGFLHLTGLMPTIQPA